MLLAKSETLKRRYILEFSGVTPAGLLNDNAISLLEWQSIRGVPVAAGRRLPVRLEAVVLGPVVEARVQPGDAAAGRGQPHRLAGGPPGQLRLHGGRHLAPEGGHAAGVAVPDEGGQVGEVGKALLAAAALRRRAGRDHDAVLVQVVE